MLKSKIGVPNNNNASVLSNGNKRNSNSNAYNMYLLQC